MQAIKIFIIMKKYLLLLKIMLRTSPTSMSKVSTENPCIETIIYALCNVEYTISELVTLFYCWYIYILSRDRQMKINGGECLIV